MLGVLVKQWFLVALVILITLGLVAGLSAPEAANWLAGQMRTVWVTAVVLFLMSFTLDTRQLQAALRSPAPVLWGCLLNLGVAPALGWALMPIQTLPDFQVGLLIAASVPCTMAAASVWTRRAHGNDAVSLLVTLATNSVAVVVTPYWLGWVLGAGDYRFDPGSLSGELIYGVLIPLGLGQLCRQWGPCGRFASQYKSPLSLLAQVCILLIVLVSALKGGVRITESGHSGLTVVNLGLVWISTIIVHVLTLWLGFWVTKLGQMSLDNRIAVAFSGSQKTLPVGLLISDAIGQSTGLTFLVFPMLMYHASQLFIDTLVAERFADLAKAEVKRLSSHEQASTIDSAVTPAVDAKP